MGNELMQKLSKASLVSWEELYAIGDDADAVAKELSLSVLDKVKLKALLQKLPSKSSPQNEKKENEAEIDIDLKNLRYVKTQILFLKEENLRLTKISNENSMKQQMMELWDTIFYKDVEL